MVNYNDNSTLKKFLSILIMFFITMMAFYVAYGYKTHVPMILEELRLIVTSYYFIMILISFYDINHRKFLFFNFVAVVIIVLYINFSYWRANMPYFNGTIDAGKYISMAVTYGHLSYGDYVAALYKNGFSIDDLGNFSLWYIANAVYPDKGVIVIFVALLNCVFLYITSIYLYKLSYLYLKNVSLSRVTAILYSAAPFSIMTIADGLKEVFFVMFIVISLYYICLATVTQSRVNLYKAIPFMIATYFFRIAIFYMLVLSFLTALFSTNKHKKALIVGMFIGSILGFFFLPFILETFMGRTQEALDYAYHYRFDRRSTSMAASTLPMISAFLGPFASMNRALGAGMTFVSSSTNYMKSLFGIWYLYGLYHIIKHYKSQVYPLFVYCLSSLVMMTQTGISLDIRYHYTYIPFFFFVAVYGYCNGHFSRRRFVSFVYFSIIIAMTIIYNSRQVYLSHSV